MLNSKQKCLLFGTLAHIVVYFTSGTLVSLLSLILFTGSVLVCRRYLSLVIHRSGCINSAWIVRIIPYISFVQKTIVSFLHDQKYMNRPDLDITVEHQCNVIVNYISRDFINTWYDILSDNQSFIGESTVILGDLKDTTLKRLKCLNKYEILQSFVVLYHKHLFEYLKAKHIYRVQPKLRLKRDKSHQFRRINSIVEAFENENSFHVALQSRDTEVLYLRTVIDICMKQLVTDDLYSCHPSRDLLTEILSANALIRLLEIISDPNWLHYFIIKLTSDEDIEQVHVAKDYNDHNENTSYEEENTPSRDIRRQCVDFFIDPEEDIPLERPSPVGCEAGHAEIEVKQISEAEKSEQLSSSIEIAERNGLFDIANFTRAISGQSLDGMVQENDFGQVEQAEDVWSKSPERFEQPLNLVVELSITGSERMKEHGTLGVYTIYVIQYLAWYKTSQGTWQVQPRTVKRRYREFVALQERMEEHPQLRHLLKTVKGIKGPSKWLNLPFSRMDEAHIEKRRLFLQKYLQNIVDNRELSYSLAVREFLAYEGDPGIAFVRKPSDVQRFDQVFVQTVKSVGSAIEKLADSLPSLSESPPTRHIRHSSRDLSQESVVVWPTGLDPHALGVTLETPMHDQGYQDMHSFKLRSLVDAYDVSPRDLTFGTSLLNDISDFSDDLAADHDVTAYHDVVADHVVTAFHDVLERTLPRLQADGSDNHDTVQDAIDREVPLTQCLLDLALQTIHDRDCWVQRESAVRLFKVLLGKFLDSFVRSELDDATTPKKCAYYLWELTDTLWPGGQLDTSPPRDPSPEQRDLTRAQARRCLYNFFPGFLPHIIGVEDFNYAVDEVMASLDDPKLNKHFAYCLVDMLVEKMFPDIQTAELQRQLLHVTDPHHLPDDTA